MPDRNLTSATIGSGSPSEDEGPSAASRARAGRVFDHFAVPDEPRSFAPPPASTWPALDLNETGRAYTVTAELPGIDEGDVEVVVRDNILTIRGEKHDERGDKQSDRVYIERSYGRFERTVPFDTQVDADKMQVRARNGVLTVILPKNPSA
jgi:HSP20 family protein